MSQAQSEERTEGQPRTDYSAQEATMDHRKQQLELGDMVQQTLSPNAEDGGDNSELNLDNETIENIEVLLKVLKGRMDRNMAEQVPHPGGQPRKWRRMTNFDGSPRHRSGGEFHLVRPRYAAVATCIAA